MATYQFPYAPIRPGYVWDLQMGFSYPLFPEGTKLRVQVRRSPTDPVVGTLTTENGLIEIVNEKTVYVKIEPEMTAKLRSGSAWFDFARTDLAEPTHLGVSVKVPVKAPVTRP